MKTYWTWPNEHVQYVLLYLLLQRIELWGGEEFCEGDVKTVADLFYCQYLWIGASAIEDVLHR